MVSGTVNYDHYSLSTMLTSVSISVSTTSVLRLKAGALVTTLCMSKIKPSVVMTS